MRRAATLPKRASSRILSLLRMLLLWIWAATDIQWFMPPATCSKPNSFAFPALLNAATARMEVRSPTVSGPAQVYGARERRPDSKCRLLRAIRNYRFDGLTSEPGVRGLV